MSLQAFDWTEQFNTGIDSVDAQHRHLVDLVNQVGTLLIENRASDDELQVIFKQLAEYARYHFGDEERVMKEGGVAGEHIEKHQARHHSFVEQVVAMWQGRGSMSNPAETLHGFLSAWLTFHILGEDQSMARQIAAIRTGTDARTALAMEAGRGERSTDALLHALQKLYGVLSQQNKDLAAANRELETKVAERTTELAQANASLENERQELIELLQKVDQAQSALLQSEKMASIGQLAAGVAHEINNPIGFVNSNVGTLTRYVADLLRLADLGASTPEGQRLKNEIDLDFLRSDVTALLTESRDGLDRVRKIVANLKDFAHVDEAEWQQADLVAGLESTLNVVWHELKYKAEIVRELVPLPLVRCIPAQINQVFMNLLVNAAQAITGQGTITLRCGTERDLVWIEVTDTGVGMSEDVKRRLFEPFFTTKPVGTGTGLGMSLAYDIIHKHGGSIDVTSAPGAGSTFRIWLPTDGPKIS